MSKIELGFDPQVVRGLVDREDWEPDEPGRERRAVGLGSVMSLTPSGKYYMPFACGNLNPCPCCNGTGNVRPRVKRRTVKKWAARNRRQRGLWLRRYGAAPNWPPRVRAASDRLNALVARGEPTCGRCGGTGSHEAWDDEKWNEAAEAALDAVGLGLETSEGDGTYLLAVEYRDASDAEDAA